MKRKSKPEIKTGFNPTKKIEPDQKRKRDLHFYKKFLQEITSKHKLALTSQNQVRMQFNEERPSLKSVKNESSKKFDFTK